jgi:hypothetical protein
MSRCWLLNSVSVSGIFLGFFQVGSVFGIGISLYRGIGFGIPVLFLFFAKQ